MKKVIVLFLMALVCISCGKKEDNVIKIGAVLSMTGSGAEYGQDQKKALELMMELNKNRTLKYDYDIIFQDSKSDPKEGVSALNQIINTEKIDFVLSVLSSVSMAIIPITEKNNIPLFCVGSNPLMTNNQKYVFRSLPMTNYQIKQLANFIMMDDKVKTIGIVYINDDFGVGSLKSFKETLLNSSKKIISVEAVNPNQANYLPTLAKITSYRPDAIFIASYGESLAQILKQLYELKYNNIKLATLEVSYPKVLDIAQNAAEGVIYVDTEYLIGENDKNEFIAQFIKKYSKYPTLDALLAHDEFDLIINICESVGKNLQNFINIKGKDIEYQSPIGNYTISSAGDFLYKLVLRKINNHKPVLYYR
jgi:branched-chain amino acid transport system substrate-binding protein